MSNIYRVVDLERCSKDEKYLSRNLGYSRSNHTLCIKLPDGNWFPIGGDVKQFKLTAGSNIDEKKLYEEGTIATVPDIDIDTMTLDSENPFQPIKHKGLVKLSEVHNSAFLPLIKDGSGDLLKEGKADAALIASMVHTMGYTVDGIKKDLDKMGVPVRM